MIRIYNASQAAKSNDGWFANFSAETSMHGVKYFGERQRHWIERTFWFCSFILTMMFCCSANFKTYKKWQESPVIVSSEEKFVNVWDIAFPAVTICPETQMQREHFNFDAFESRFLKTVQDQYNFTDDEREKISAVLHVCEFYDDYLNNLTEQNIHLIDPANLIPILRNIAVDRDDSFIECVTNSAQMNTEQGDCRNFLEEKITDYGICYTFNGLDQSEIFKESS